jgi:DNA invertase Pin-like site-specific DNA recombinase
MAAARNRGKVIGRRPVKVNIDEALRLMDAGRSIREVAGRLKIGYGTLQRALHVQATVGSFALVSA